jgi:RNA polymerase sigma-70 factor (ECF subfamily)
MGAAPTDPHRDDDLVARAQLGNGLVDGKVAAELLGRYTSRVLAFCRKYVRDPDQAMDLSQDILIAAYEALPRFERRSPFSAWLFTIARNRCLRAVRRPGWIRDEDVDLSQLRDPATPEDQRVESEQEQSAMERMMEEHLDPIERKALILRCVECLSVEEISRVLDIRQASGARGVLQTARRKLRAALRIRETGR